MKRALDIFLNLFLGAVALILLWINDINRPWPKRYISMFFII